MENNFPGGVWPTMITPFTKEGKVDFIALEKIIEWYLKSGVSGLFSVCQSSEMFKLSLEERVEIAKFTKKISAGRVPVIASGHISDSFNDQVVELNAIAETGVDAVILITNRLAQEEDDESVMISYVFKLIDKIPKNIPLGFYECPFPYKRLLSPKAIKIFSETNRFFFLKDTCCDSSEIKKKIEATKYSNLKLYNANTTTLLQSLNDGAVGYSGVMANFQPELYVWLCNNIKHTNVQEISDSLTICSLIERQLYPINAKYFMQLKEIPLETISRVKCNSDFTSTFANEIESLYRMTHKLKKQLNI